MQEFNKILQQIEEIEPKYVGEGLVSYNEISNDCEIFLNMTNFKFIQNEDQDCLNLFDFEAKNLYDVSINKQVRLAS